MGFYRKSYPLRKVNKCRGIYDLSAVYDAAYTSTEITTRSIEDLEKHKHQFQQRLKEMILGKKN